MKKIILIAIVFCLTFSLAFGSLQFGQTGGKLDFGEIYIGESETLQYSIINPNNQSIQFEMIYPKNLIVNPENGTIRANGQQEINVTVIGNETGTFKGNIRARLSSIEGDEEKQGAIFFQLEVEKDFSYEVIEKPKEENNRFLLYVVLGLIVTFLMLSIFLYIRKRR